MAGLDIIKPGDARYPALAIVAGRHGMTPDAWQKRARAEESRRRRRSVVERVMRQIPQYRGAVT